MSVIEPLICRSESTATKHEDNYVNILERLKLYQALHYRGQVKRTSRGPMVGWSAQTHAVQPSLVQIHTYVKSFQDLKVTKYVRMDFGEI